MTTVNYVMALHTAAEVAAVRDTLDGTNEHPAAEAKLRAAVEGMEQELETAKEHLVFIERVAVHHGSKSFMTPEQALSTIQHYPPISAITKSYKDGKVPNTRNPWEELEAAKALTKATAMNYDAMLVHVQAERDALQAKLSAIDYYEAALKLSHPYGAQLDVFENWNKARIAAGAAHKEPLSMSMFASKADYEAAQKEQCSEVQPSPQPTLAAVMPCGAVVSNVHEAYEAGRKAQPAPQQGPTVSGKTFGFMGLEAQPVAQPVAWVSPQGHLQGRTETMSPLVAAEYTKHGWMPLYAAPVMYKNTQDLDTSQERVKNLEKNEHEAVPKSEWEQMVEANKMLLEALKGIANIDARTTSSALAPHIARAAIEKAEKL